MSTIKEALAGKLSVELFSLSNQKLSCFWGNISKSSITIYTQLSVFLSLC